MRKEEAKKYIREKIGFIPYVQLFDIYKDDEDISKEDIDALFLMKSEQSSGDFIICSAPLAEQLNEILNKK